MNEARGPLETWLKVYEDSGEMPPAHVLHTQLRRVDIMLSGIDKEMGLCSWCGASVTEHETDALYCRQDHRTAAIEGSARWLPKLLADQYAALESHGKPQR